MKKAVRWTFIALFAVILLLAAIVYRLGFYYPDIEIKVAELYNAPESVVQLGGTYYRLKDGILYDLDNEETIFRTDDENSFGKVYNDLIWVMDNGELKAVSSTGEIVSSCYLHRDTKNFLISGDTVFCMLPYGIRAYSLNSGGQAEEIRVEFSPVYDSESCGFHLSEYRCGDVICLFFDTDHERSDCYFIADTNTGEIIGNDRYFVKLLDIDGEHIVFAPAKFDLKKLYEYSFADKSEKEYEAEVEDTRFFEKTPYTSDGEYIISIGQITTLRAVKRVPPTVTSDKMAEHSSDRLYAVSRSDLGSSILRKTGTFERIIYADSQKAVTYCSGKYLTYSVDEWKVTDKQPAVEIKSGGSYTFETCGDHIFVFDSSDKLLNRIKLD